VLKMRFSRRMMSTKGPFRGGEGTWKEGRRNREEAKERGQGLAAITITKRPRGPC